MAWHDEGSARDGDIATGRGMRWIAIVAVVWWALERGKTMTMGNGFFGCEGFLGLEEAWLGKIREYRGMSIGGWQWQ